MWWSDPKTKEEDKIIVTSVLKEIEEFADNSGLRYDRRFARFFTDEKQPSLYGYLAGASEDQRNDLQLLINEIHKVQLEQAMAGIPCECLRKRARQRLPSRFFEPPQIPVYKDYNARAMHAGTVRQTIAELEDITAGGVMMEVARQSFSATSRLSSLPGLVRRHRIQDDDKLVAGKVAKSKTKKRVLIGMLLAFVVLLCTFGGYAWIVKKRCDSTTTQMASCPLRPTTLSSNAKIDQSGGDACTKLTIKSECAVKCKDGFVPVDDKYDSVYTCGDAGEWIAEHPLVCAPRHCGAAISGLDPNAQACADIASHDTFKSTCSAHCTAGYNSSGSGDYACDTAGHWVVAEGRERLQCHRCPHGRYAPFGHTGDCLLCGTLDQCEDQQYVSCTGKRKVDRECARCKSGFTANAQCAPVDCGDTIAGLDENSHSNCTGRTTFEGRCAATCTDGYSCRSCADPNATSAVFTCAASGTWRGNFSCTADVCTGGTVIQHSKRHGADSPCQTSTGEQCEYECEDGFDRLGNHTCYPNGTLIGVG